jgi:ribosomal protein L7Ae-like RNA K-turn-binding protein
MCFCKQVGSRIFILLLYVDDILAIVDEEEAEKIRAHLVAKFGTVVFEINGKLSYLGMEIELSDKGTKIDMSFYVKQIIEDAEEKLVLTKYESPGTKETFVAHEGAGVLSEKNRVYFHSTVAKLLYLAKRARPDILTVVTYLCTRVQHATVEDEKKLGRVLGYLKGTVGRTLLLKRSSMESTVVAYVDAAYALHGDSKSHMGVVIYVGGTLAYVASRKQKCISKSPTEAELVALTDNLGLVELFQEFVEFVTKKRIAPPLVYQDCNAVITLVTKGGGKLRTKHLRARMHLGKEMVDEGRIVVVYKCAEGMEADGFSKPYDPAKHKPFAAMIQGEDKAGQQVGAMQNREHSQVMSQERSRKVQPSGAVDNEQIPGNV